jgi:hypothetical protein
MRFDHVAIVALTYVIKFHLRATCKTIFAHAVVVTDNSNDHGDDDTVGVVQFDRELFEEPSKLSSRLLQGDEMCSSACTDGTAGNLVAAITTDAEKQDDDGGGPVGRIFGRINGFFRSNQGTFGRLMNGIFNIITRRRRRGTKYMIPTSKIVPLLSNYSAKFNALAAMIRDESESAAAQSTTPDLIRLMYNISAKNMESVATLLDPILDVIRQQDSMDIRDVSCSMMQIVTVMRDVTFPTIEQMAQVLYTKSKNQVMVVAIDKYATSKTVVASNSFPVPSNNAESTCLDGASTTTAVAQMDGRRTILDFFFDSNMDVGPVVHLVRIIGLIVLIPVSIVISILGVIVFILYLLFSILLPGIPDLGNDGLYSFYVVILFVAAIGAPYFTIMFLLRNIRELFKDLLDPFLPDPPAVTSYPTPAPVAAPNSAPSTRLNVPQVSDIKYRLSMVLESPLDMMSDLFQDGSTIASINQGEEDAMDCEISALMCNNDALLDTLPF